MELSTLDEFMASCGHDITNFNGNIKILLDSLKDMGETTNYLLTNLFKGYDVCSEKVSVKYITRTKEGYKEGFYIVPGSLMHLAVQK